MNAYLIHENDDWLPPFRAALRRADVPFEEWRLHEGHFDLTEEPPPGVYFNRMSASAHTRGHTASVAHARVLLPWLEARGRRVLNGAAALRLEMSKAQQGAALQRAGLRVPPTRVVSGGAEALAAAAEDLPLPFVVKPNRGGKGLGVQRFGAREAFRHFLHESELDPNKTGRALSPDGITLLQAYVEPAAPFVTRCEFVGGRFLYAIRADTSQGFELCPAEACRMDGAGDDAPLFTLREDVPANLIERYERFMQQAGLDIAGIEFIEDAEGRAWTYDVNGTTNYNPDVEAAAGESGADAVAALIARELDGARREAETRASASVGA